jgi:hypothetical protein
MAVTLVTAETSHHNNNVTSQTKLSYVSLFHAVSLIHPSVKQLFLLTTTGIFASFCYVKTHYAKLTNPNTGVTIIKIPILSSTLFNGCTLENKCVAYICVNTLVQLI